MDSRKAHPIASVAIMGNHDIIEIDITKSALSHFKWVTLSY